MQRLHTLSELRERCANSLILWAAQDMGSGVQVWAHRSAIGVAVTRLAGRDRLAVVGQVDHMASIVAAVLADNGPCYRPMGDAEAIRQLCTVIPGKLTATPPYGWMTTRSIPDHHGRARLALESEHADIGRLLDDAFPGSSTRPGDPGVTRWWVHADDVGVSACACEGWSSPDVGLLAGVATAARVRGQSLGKSVTATALAALVRAHGTAALIVEAGNVAARSLYESMGMAYRPIRTAVPEGR